MSSLPEELYLEILKRVPVNSTFACKCVCKSWFKLISNLDFDLMHLNLSMQRYKLMIESHKGISFSSVSYDSLSSSSNTAVVEMNFPHKSSKCKIKLLGSCNGVVCFWNYRLKCYFVWNPATEEYKKIDKADSDKNNNFDYSALYGFGYDHRTDDYMLVSILTYDQLIHVYSSKSSSWISFQSNNDELNNYTEAGVFLNGALHWLWEGDTAKILSMKIGEERFEELKLPAALPKTQYYMDMGVLEGCIYVLARFKEFFEVWVMQDYGAQESWTRLHYIRFELMMWDDFGFGQLMGSCTNGQILFRQSDVVVLYDPKYGTARKLSIPGLKVEDRAVSYFESLVSLNSITAVGRRKKRTITRNLKASTSKKRNRNA